jgi:hypothetical protein
MWEIDDSAAGYVDCRELPDYSEEAVRYVEEQRVIACLTILKCVLNIQWLNQ